MFFFFFFRFMEISSIVNRVGLKIFKGLFFFCFFLFFSSRKIFTRSSLLGTRAGILGYDPFAEFYFVENSVGMAILERFLLVDSC